MAATRSPRLPWRRRALLAGLAAPALGAPGAAARRSRVSLLVGAPAGSGSDTWARSFAPFLERHWPGHAVDILNRPGERGLLAARLLATAPPDSGLIGAVATPQLIASAVAAETPALLDGLLFLAAVAEEPLVLVAQPGTATDLASLWTPGDQVRAPAIIGMPPPGTAAQLAASALARMAPLSPLAFPSAGAARQAVLAGNIACAMLALPDCLAALRDGRLAAFAVTTRERLRILPEVATFAEQGVALRITVHRGFAVPADVDPALALPLVRACRGACEDPDFQSQSDMGGLVPGFLDQHAWRPFLGESTTDLMRQWTVDPWMRQRK